jgi:hypothetical protein
MLLRRKHLSGRINVGHLLKLRLLPLSLFPPLFFLLSASVLGFSPLFCLTLSLLLFCLLTRSNFGLLLGAGSVLSLFFLCLAACFAFNLYRRDKRHHTATK